MRSACQVISWSFLMASINGVIAGFDADTQSNIAIYWGMLSWWKLHLYRLDWNWCYWQVKIRMGKDQEIFHSKGCLITVPVSSYCLPVWSDSIINALLHRHRHRRRVSPRYYFYTSTRVNIMYNQVIPLAFLTVINGVGGQPEINFANQGNDCSTFNGTALLDCPNIA